MRTWKALRSGPDAAPPRPSPPPPSSAYSIAKAALHSLTRHLAMGLAPHGIRANAVAPAVVRTPIYEEFIPKADLARPSKASTPSTR